MSFAYQERVANSPLVKNIWHTYSSGSGVFVAAPDGCWDIIFTKYDGKMYIAVNGQATTAVMVPYGEGAESLGISFKPEAFLTRLPGERLVDAAVDLAIVSKAAFHLDGQTYEIPTFENADSFIKKLLRGNVLAHNDIVGQVLGGHREVVSERTQQRHFLRTTGLTPYYFSQLKRAQKAVILLQQGKRPIDVALEAGYSDQPHMARAIKHIMGRTPAQIASRT